MSSQVCVGEAEPEYGLSRRDAQEITQRIMNLLPKGVRVPRFPFFSFGGSTSPGQCGCKCESRQVRFISPHKITLIRLTISCIHAV